MRRKPASGITLTLLLIVMLTLASNIQLVSSEPNTWTVDDDGPADFHTIQEAVNAASPRDTIFVKAGTYYEHVVINKNDLKLVGEDKVNTIIDGNMTGTVIKVAANNVVINGFTIQNSGSPQSTTAGIQVSGRVRVCNITGNHVTRNRIGIFVTSLKSVITKNIVTYNGQGIVLYDSSDVSVEANNVTANQFGITLDLSSNNLIVGNRVTNSSEGGHGIKLSSDSFNNTVSSNVFINNYHGMWLVGSSGNFIVKNTIANNKLLGIELASSPHNTFYHNNFVNNGIPPFTLKIEHIRIGGNPMNIWDNDYPSGGNYWADYIDADVKTGQNQDQPGSDGIWDNPYVIDENNEDRYPSVKPYGELPDSVLDKTKPIANAGQDKTVSVGTPVTFDASGSIDDVGIISYEWNFGDGTTETGVVATHTYTQLGVYTVTLAVKDAADNSDEDSIVVTVVENLSDEENQPSSESFPPWINWMGAAIIGIAIMVMLVGRRRKYRRIRRVRRKK